jgi:hypothetical protein
MFVKFRVHVMSPEASPTKRERWLCFFKVLVKQACIRELLSLFKHLRGRPEGSEQRMRILEVK